MAWVLKAVSKHPAAAGHKALPLQIFPTQSCLLTIVKTTLTESISETFYGKEAFDLKDVKAGEEEEGGRTGCSASISEHEKMLFYL